MLQIRKLRKDLDLSLVALANRCGMDHAPLSKIERGVTHPTTTTLRKIADGLGVQVRDLFTEITEEDVANPATLTTQTGPGNALAVKDD